MKKVYNSTDIHQNQGQELSKKLYRSISEQAKRLDDARSCARNIGELFSPALCLQRRKFCDYCERLIFSDPVLYGKKSEELLWRKSFYDVVSSAKKLKKNEYSAEEISNLQGHINSGIGYYHHFLSRIQNEYNLNLNNIIDFSFELDLKKDVSYLSPKSIEWAQLAVHQCLIYLGDLSRYKLDIYPNWEPTLANRYYLQAILYKPEHGMPHNQMGTLSMGQNKFLDAVYHYIRCLGCKYSFEGTSNNLHSLFEKNSKFVEQIPDENEDTDCIIEPSKTESIKRFIARFLLLIDIWYFNKKVTKLYNLCHQTFKNLEECLSYPRPTSADSEESPTDSNDTDSTSTSTYLSSDILFKIVVICLLCVSKLKSSNSQHLSTVVAFTLAVYSQIIQNITSHMQESILNYPLSEEVQTSQNGIIKDLVLGGKKSKNLLRRRKIVKVNSDDESEQEDSNSVDDYSSSDDSFISENEDILANSSDEEGAITKEIGKIKEVEIKETSASDENTLKKKSESNEELLKKVQRMDVNDMLEIIGEESNLQSIKLLNDWLKSDQDTLKSCGANTGSFLRQIAQLLNLININLHDPKISGTSVSEIIAKENRIPLAEDAALKGLNILGGVQSDLDWNYLHKKSFTPKDETVIRIIKLISFGKLLLTIEETGVTFNETKNMFVCAVDDKEDIKLPDAIIKELELNDSEGAQTINGHLNVDDNSATSQESKSNGQLMKMKHMGQLWLAAEVKALENRVRGKTALSPYLVLDADALIKFTYMVKHLVHSRKFIVLVPTAVVSALDDLKSEKIEARDAIRWLESQFQQGNRFFRAQRPHEKAPIPFVKYPKKRDKEMHIYIQIIECCNYLAEQQKDAPNLVTLLIGNQNVVFNGENREFSYLGLAQSVGITIESIAQFYGKWKKTKIR